MTHPNHKRLNALATAHPGLVLDKLGLHLIFKDKSRHTMEVLKAEETKKVSYPGDREEVMKKVKWLFNDSYIDLYQTFYRDWENRLKFLEERNKAIILKARLKDKFVTGLSGAAAMQMGFTLHHTWGVYYIPGTSVKGAVMNTGEAPSPEDRVIFADAFPEPESVKQKKMISDVITPHHMNYYNDEKGYQNAPDIEDPVPVMFLAVPPGVDFMFAFLSDKPALLDAIPRAFEAACEAGFGGKISSGYGYFEPLKYI